MTAPAPRFADAPLHALFALAVGALAWPTLTWWAWEWTRPDSPSAYALAVLPLALCMFWRRRDLLVCIPAKIASEGLLLTVFALTLLAVSVKRELLAVSSLALWLTVIGAVWFSQGRARLKALAVPLGFLLTLAPLPGPLLSDATLGAQGLSTSLAARLLGLFGLHPVQSGTIIQLDRYALDVVAPCSGFKLLLTLLVLGAALAALTDLPRGKKLALAALTLPLSLLVNALRIALVGLVGEAGGFSAAGRFHDASGYLCLVLCLVALASIGKGMGCRTLCGQPLF